MAVVGRIARPHGIRGQVVVVAESDFPEERFRAGAELFARDHGEVRTLTLSAVRFHHGRPIVGFEGVDRIEDAEPLVGLELRVPIERLAKLPAGVFYRHDLVGCHVETPAGRPIGIVGDVEGPLHASRLVVVSGGGEILIPLASAICTTIDPGARRIVVDPPEGLLELNVNRGEPVKRPDRKGHGTPEGGVR